jgi:two-component system, sensor histidine kinase LadS
MMVIVLSMAWIAWKSQTWLWALVASLIPIILSALAQIAYNFGWVRHVEQAQLLGVIVSCLGLLIIYASLVVQSRSHLTSTVREDVIDTKDVATGLFNERVAMARLPQVILRSRRFERSCGVLLVRWVDLVATLQRIPDSTTRGRVLAHLGARLARVARDIDTVARVGDDLFMVLVEAPVTREMLNQIASKILAGCMRPSQYMPEHKGFDMHVAVWSSTEIDASATQVLEMLKTRIDQMRDGTLRRVQFIDSPLSTGPGREVTDPQKHSEELLAKINSLEATHGLPTIALNQRKSAPPTADKTPDKAP